jgi:hypothetical protein
VTEPACDRKTAPGERLLCAAAAGALIGILLITFAPVLTHSYGMLDDYALLQIFRSGGDVDDRPTIWQAFTASGRPTLIPFVQLFYGHIHNIAELRYLRAFSIICIALLAAFLWRTLTRFGWPRWSAASMALIVCTMPPFQVYAAWAIESFFPLAALLAGAASYLADRAANGHSLRGNASRLVSAIALQMIALTIFQPAGMFSCVFMVIALFSKDLPLPQFIRRLVVYGAVLLAGLALAFAIYRIGQALYPTAIAVSRSNLAPHVWPKAVWFVQTALRDALNLANFPASDRVATVVGALLLLGLFAVIRGPVGERLMKVGIALAIVPLSYLPNLLVAENWPAYRSQVALTSVVAIYALFALHRVLLHSVSATRYTVFAGLLAVVSCMSASFNVVTYFVLPQSLELAVMRNQLRQVDLGTVRTLYIRSADWRDHVTPVARYDEFGLPSTATSWSPRPIAALLLSEMDHDYRQFRIEVQPADSSLTARPDAAVIDMRKLSGFR